ncbi:MAG TPA: LON peptidase substrate-binding domain-containing protein, partial [Polyangiaceae bacterium]|nr:LON peptidase substrate-binding domain-containing protein [Polyangiaceae bacterium]
MAEALPPLLAEELEALPIFPLGNVALFPHASLPLHVFEPRYRQMTRDVLSGNRLLAVARLKPGFEDDYAGRPPVFDVCGVGRIARGDELPDGRYNILLRGISRVRIVEELLPEHAYRVVRAEQLSDRDADLALVSAWQQRLSLLWLELAPHLPPAVRDLRELTRDALDAGGYADRITSALIADPNDSQRLLEELDPAERLHFLVER